LIYTKTVTAPANMTAANPASTDIPVTNGLIYKVEFDFPPGSSGLLHIWIKDGSFPLWPSEPGESFSGDNQVIAFDDKYFIQAPDHRLKLWYYNLDDTYDHEFQVRVGQVLQEVFIASFLPSIGQGDMTSAITEAIAAQTVDRESKRQEVLDYLAAEPYEPENEGVTP